eukprot:scaffold80424_cov70-Cyclotella_meneghiniana.AAC.1
MMMERAKTAPAPEEEAKPEATSSKPAPASSQDRVVDLERRLNDLDSTLERGGSTDNQAVAKPAIVESHAAATPTAVERPKQEEQKQPTNPLLARIMAAQERARIAEQKEKEAKEAAAKAEADRKRNEEAAAIAEAKLKELQRLIDQTQTRKVENEQTQQEQHREEQKAQQKLLKQRQSETRDRIMRDLRGLTATDSTKAESPPPPFDAMALVDPRPQLPYQEDIGQLKQPPEKMPPPTFDNMQQHMAVPAPSAPPVSPTHDHLAGVLPMPAPMMAASMPPPPSFAEFEQQMQQKPAAAQLKSDTSYDFDVDGIPLSPEEIEEQRRLYESITKEKEANDEAIARAASAFDSRSASAKAEERIDQMDSMGRDLDHRAAAAPPGELKTDDAEDDVNAPRRFVKIGGNQTVALHGQERTKKAIKEGTALLVQCMNCQNWMQVTASATLMFCPVCQVVCPVVRQSEVLTKEQAIQLTMDRKLAEKLQAESYIADENKPKEGGYFARLFGSGESSTSTAPATTNNAAPRSNSWWNTISSIVSYGVEEESHRGEIGVTRPPGASTTNSSISAYPGQRRPGSLTPASVTGTEETRGLLTTTPTSDNLHPVVVHGNEANLPAGRIAEQRPLLSCVYDSVSSAASAVFTNDEPDEEGNVYGVDARSLLAVTERDDEEGEASSRHFT